MSPVPQRIVQILLLIAAAGFVRLGIWQLHRLHERRAANRVTLAARNAPPIALTPASNPTVMTMERRVVARGRYDEIHDVVIRGEALEGVPGVRIVTPLLLAAGGPAVLVDRGFLPAPDAVTASMAGMSERGDQTVVGLARAIESGSGEPLEQAGRTTWRRLDLSALRARLPYRVLPIVIAQQPDPALPSFPRRIPAPAIDDGPHLSYAIQWFLFAGLAIAFAVLVVGRRPGTNATVN